MVSRIHVSCDCILLNEDSASDDRCDIEYMKWCTRYTSGAIRLMKKSAYLLVKRFRARCVPVFSHHNMLSVDKSTDECAGVSSAFSSALRESVLANRLSGYITWTGTSRFQCWCQGHMPMTIAFIDTQSMNSR